MAIEHYIRIDKWLWAARFFKNRNSAATAVNGGKVHVNGQRIKPSKQIKKGDMLKITLRQAQVEIEVNALSNKRGSPKDAQKLYKEFAESIEKRELELEQRKIHNASVSQQNYTPDKRQRRQIRKASGKI